jgi:hypothetical protein
MAVQCSVVQLRLWSRRPVLTTSGVLRSMCPTGCVEFADAATARRAIAGSGHPLAPEELMQAPDDMDQVMTDAGLDPAGGLLRQCIHMDTTHTQ